MLNFDGSRGESNAKENTKVHFQRTQKRFHSVNFQTATRLYEATIVNHASDVFHDSKFDNKNEHDNNTNGFRHNHSSEQVSDCMPLHEGDEEMKVGGSRYSFSLEYLMQDEVDAIQDSVIDLDGDVYKVNFKWEKTTPLEMFPKKILQVVARRLFFHKESGGTLMHYTTVKGFTELKLSETIFRSHPFYRSEDLWMDWAMFSREDYDDPVPARIIMLLDLRESRIMNHIEQKRFFKDRDPMENDDSFSDEDSSRDSYEHPEYLTNDLWCLVHSADAPTWKPEDGDDHDYLLDSALATRIKMETLYRLLPAKMIVRPCFVMFNDPTIPYEEGVNDHGIVLTEPSDWSNSTFFNFDDKDIKS